MKRFGLVGKDIQYSQSKKLFDKAFKGEYSYEIIDTDKISKELFLEYDGLNVTTPYKKEAFKYVDDKSANAIEAQSTNCIFNDNGKLWGFNTDYYGFMVSLMGHDIGSILVLGNGGVVETIKSFARLHKIRLDVCGRSGEYDINYKDLRKYDYDCIVNATKFGVVPPIDYSKIDKKTLAFDLCYGDTTAFLEECKKFSHDYNMDGELMLKSQAKLSWELWGLKVKK